MKVVTKTGKKNNSHHLGFTVSNINSTYFKFQGVYFIKFYMAVPEIGLEQALNIHSLKRLSRLREMYKHTWTSN